MMKRAFTRRSFLKSATAAGAGIGLGMAGVGQGAESSTGPSINVLGANDKVRIAVVGTNSRGLVHVDCFLDIPGVELVFLCDVMERALAAGVKRAARLQKTFTPTCFIDYREMLKKPFDAVTIATPDHWHAPMAILALQAGKHVYVEKPCSHNPYEGELLIEAVQKYNKVVQMGNQRRSFNNMIQAMKDIQGGIIGRAYFAKAWYANNRASIGRGKPAEVPKDLDYDLWQGPAPRRPYKDNVIPYNWHWFWNWGTGEALNNGTHEVDVCRWALGVDWPTRVVSHGGRYQWDDDWETPDTQVIGWDYAQGKSISWESRSCNDFPVENKGRGALIYGTTGTALLEGNNYTVYDSKRKVVKELKDDTKADPTDKLSASGIKLDQVHMKDFIDCIRTGKKPNSPITEGHKSCAMLHLGNIAWRVGRELHLDPANGHIKDDPEAMKLWRREYEPGWEPKV
jgi:predicted dehydrogenase